MSRPAVFLDRDGTIIQDTEYLGTPDEVELIAGASNAIRRLNDAGIPVVVVTNQSGIARGYYSEADYDRVRDRLTSLLSADGAHLDASYMCPHLPEITGACECRKPGTLLFRQAADDLDLDLAASWYVGDKLRDVAPAREFGGSGILVPSRETSADQIEAARSDKAVEPSLDSAVSRIMASRR